MSGISGKVNEKSYDIADIVLGKIKGFPPWPARVVDPEEVPAAVTADRPTGKKYYCVRFFPAGDFAWLTARDINPLPTTEINKFLAAPKGVKRSLDLLSGYRIALDPTEWESTINERIAKAVEASAAGDDDDELEGEEGEGKKKRRRSEGGATGGSAKKKRRTTKAGKSAEMVESEDDAAGNVSTISAAPTSAVPTKKKDKDEEDEKFAHLKDDKGAQHIKLVRHALQKMFLSKTAPTDKDIENGDGLFKELEAGDIPLDYLGYSKIGKVMRHIASLEDAQIPREAEFKFKIRAQDLVAKWHKVAANNPNSRASAGATAAPANGNGV